MGKEPERSSGTGGKNIFSVYRNETDKVTRHDALYKYIKVKQNIARRTERFGIVNNQVFISSEQMEVLGMCDRIYAVHNGKISGEFDRKEASQESLMRASAGL